MEMAGKGCSLTNGRQGRLFEIKWKKNPIELNHGPHQVNVDVEHRNGVTFEIKNHGMCKWFDETREMHQAFPVKEVPHRCLF